MSNTKCPRCGLFSWTGAEVCKCSGVPLDGSDPDAHAPEPARPDFPLLTLGRDVQTGSRTWMLVLVVIFAVAMCGAAWAIYNSRRGGSSAEEAKRKKFATPNLDERTRDTMLAYLAQPGFAGTKVGEQVLGPVRLELLQVRDREVYFSAPAPEQTGEAFEAMVARFIIDPKRVVQAEDDGAGHLRLGKYSLTRLADKHFFFKTPKDNVKFDPKTVL